jgi:two-component system sensor histidine kinase BaeS
VLLVMGAGLRLRGAWVLRAAVLTGAASLLALAAVNPDAYIATHNLDRYAETGKVDTLYLSELSADAVPALSGSTVPPSCLANLTSRSDDDWLEWNLGRQRAADSLSGGSAADGVCPALP